MCGIIGYIGKQNAKPILLKALKSLEYRGYDSCGISVIENGFSKRARIPGYRLGGKTGTAQVPKPDGKGYSEKTIHSFIGFGTQDNPRFAVLVKLDNPKIGIYAEYTAMPVFKKIAQFLLDYYKIPKSIR